jgi:3-hydroxyisobutyrate dehydrogenase
MKIALIGTGIIGTPLAEKLLECGHDLIVYNRTRQKTKSLSKIGATVANSPEEAIKFAEIIILTLTDGPAIYDVLFLQGFEPDFSGKTIIQMGTILPHESLDLQEKIFEKGGSYFEAPVLGSAPDARKKSLIVMVGSTKEQYDLWKDLLGCFCEEPIYAGSVGKAATLKLAMNHLIAGMTAVFSLSLAMIQRADVDIDLFMKVLRESALYSKTYDKKLLRMLEGNYSNPNFPVKHLLKDVDLIYSEAKSLNLFTDGIECIERIIRSTIKLGFSEGDYSAIFEVLKKTN